MSGGHDAYRFDVPRNREALLDRARTAALDVAVNCECGAVVFRCSARDAKRSSEATNAMIRQALAKHRRELPCALTEARVEFVVCRAPDVAALQQVEGANPGIRHPNRKERRAHAARTVQAVRAAPAHKTQGPHALQVEAKPGEVLLEIAARAQAEADAAAEEVLS